ncbi:MAG: zinc ABC transporter substrate-binding protein [Acidilobaceae archaeon]
MDIVTKKVHEALALALILLIALPLLSALHGIAPEAQAQPLVTVTVVPPSWARVIAMIGSPFVRVVNPIPEGVDPHHYEPKPEDIEKAVKADIIVVDNLEHLPINKKLVEAARERKVPLILVEEDAMKRGWRPLKKPSGADNKHLHLDPNSTMIMVEMVIEEAVKIAKAKGAPAAQVEAMSSRLSANAAMFKSTYLSSISYAQSVLKGMSGVALYSAKTQYVAHSMGLKPVFIMLDEPEEEPKPGDIERLKASGAKCVLLLAGHEHFDERVVEDLSKAGVKVVYVNIREVMRRAGPHFVPAVTAEALVQACGKPMVEHDHHDHLHIDPVTTGLAAYAALVTVVAALLVLRRK